MAATFRDVLTNVLVTANYPEVKRQGFINTFYEYLILRIFEEIQKVDENLHQKLLGYFGENAMTSDKDIREGLQEAYQNPQLKLKIDKIIDEVTGELAQDVAAATKSTAVVAAASS